MINKKETPNLYKGNPCVPDCPDRAVGCHGTCERYKAWKKEVEERKEAAGLDYSKQEAFDLLQKRRIKRVQQYKRRK